MIPRICSIFISFFLFIIFPIVVLHHTLFIYSCCGNFVPMFKCVSFFAGNTLNMKLLFLSSAPIWEISTIRSREEALRNVSTLE